MSICGFNRGESRHYSAAALEIARAPTGNVAARCAMDVIAITHQRSEVESCITANPHPLMHGRWKWRPDGMPAPFTKTDGDAT